MSTLQTATGFAIRLDDAGQWTLTGELDCESAPALVEFARSAPTPPCALFVGVHDLRFLDAAGWQALRTAHLVIGRHRSMRLIGARAPVALVLNVLGAP